MILKFLVLLLLLCSCGMSSGSSSDGHKLNSYDLLDIKSTSPEEIWKPQYSEAIYNRLETPDLASLFEIQIDNSDLTLLGCEPFNTLTIEEKKKFYLVFLAAIAERESGFDPNNKTRDWKHRNTNLGLFQIDLESAIRHAPELISDPDTDEDILNNPRFNASVATYILRNQLEGKWKASSKNRLFPDETYYWEVLNLKLRNRVVRSFKNNLQNLPFCLGEKNE